MPQSQKQSSHSPMRSRPPFSIWTVLAAAVILSIAAYAIFHRPKTQVEPAPPTSHPAVAQTTESAATSPTTAPQAAKPSAVAPPAGSSSATKPIVLDDEARRVAIDCLRQGKDAASRATEDAFAKPDSTLDAVMTAMRGESARLPNSFRERLYATARQKDAQGREMRLRISLPDGGGEGEQRMAVQAFTVDAEGLPVIAALPPDLATLEPEEAFERFAKAPATFASEAAWTVQAGDGLRGQTVERNGRVEQVELYFETAMLGCAVKTPGQGPSVVSCHCP